MPFLHLVEQSFHYLHLHDTSLIFITLYYTWQELGLLLNQIGKIQLSCAQAL